MRIAFLCTSGLDNASPRGRWFPLARELARHGHQPHLLMLHPMYDQVTHQPFAQDGVQLHYVGQMHVYGAPGQRRYYSAPRLAQVSAQGAWALARAALALNPDLVQVCKPQPINGLAGWFAARRLGCRLFVDCDDYEAEANRFGAGLGGRVQKSLVTWWEDRLPLMAAGVTVNTRFLQQRYERLGVAPGRMRYVPNGVSGIGARKTGASGALAEARLRTTLGLGDAPVVIYVGTLSKIAHGVDLLIEAFARVLARPGAPRARLLMVGDGDDKAALMAQAQALGIASAIHWTGNLPAEAVRDYWALARCSVDPVYDTPSACGRSPLKIVESMAAGIPVVTGDVGDRREMIGPAGRIVAPGDPDALADALADLLQAPPAEPGPILARAAHYQWPQLVETWASVYDGHG